jgi:glycerol-3-phosphate acyltransferase PlsX
MMTTVAVDAMGGDRAPVPEVEGAVSAVRGVPASDALRVVLVGDAARLRSELARHGALDHPRLQVLHASEVVTMDDHPGQAYRKKADSSLRVAMELVKDGRADAFVSAGNSGAVLSHALFVLRRIERVERPGIVTVFPTPTGKVVLCDMGANVEVKPAMLAQFGILGAHYDRIQHGRERPLVGILSNGTEDTKGTELTRAASALLQRAAGNPEAQFQFVGYVEGSSIFQPDVVNVVATDGFTGNVVLKLAEGVSQAVLRMVKASVQSSWRARLGGMLVRPALLRLRQSIDYSEAGGALLLGVRGVVMICHGRSDGRAIKNAIAASRRFVERQLVDQLARAIRRHERLWEPVLPVAGEPVQDRRE